MIYLGWFVGRGFLVHGWKQDWWGDDFRDWTSSDIYLDLSRALDRACFEHVMIEDGSLIPNRLWRLDGRIFSPRCERSQGRPHAADGPAPRRHAQRLFERKHFARHVDGVLGAMSFVDPSPFTTRPEIQGTFGVVASTHWIATAVGMGMLERGGNAFDAGVATAFALQVVEPHLNGPGADVPIIVHHAKRGRTEVICGQGPTPASATIARFRELGLDLIPGTGLLAPCVPGCFDSFMLLRDYAPSRSPRRWVRQSTTHSTGTRSSSALPLRLRRCAIIFSLTGRHPLHSGSRRARSPCRAWGSAIPRLPKPIRACCGRLRDGRARGRDRAARKIWAQGFVSEAIDKFCRTEEVMDVSGRGHRGLLTGADTAAWSATIDEPIGYDYGRYRALKPGAWSQGLACAPAACAAEKFALRGARPDRPRFHSLAGRGGEARLRRPRHFLRRSGLRSRAHRHPVVGRLQRQATGDDRADSIARPAPWRHFGLRHGAGGAHSGEGRVAVGSGGSGEPTVGRLGESRGDTVHFDIIDRHGNMIAATPSGGWLQSSPTIPALGFCLGSRAQMFVLEEGHPGEPRSRQASALDAVANNGPARWRALSRLGNAGRRSAGSVDPAIFSQACSCRDESSGIDRRARLAYRALPLFVLATRRAPWRLGRGKPRAGINDHRATPPGPHHRSRARVVGRPAGRGGPRPGSIESRRQPARHAGLCSRTMKREPDS